jgi:beta-glucanase (GH16 family)
MSCSPKGKATLPVSAEDKARPLEVKIDAETFTESSGQVEVKSLAPNGAFVHATEGGWIALDVKIPVAGRYQSQIQLSSGSEKSLNCWIEDYYDNKDERTYNITGNISIPGPSSTFAVHSKDGSPLNAGLHKMKLHFDNQVNIDWVMFKLMKARVETPVTMTQNTNGTEWKVVWSDEFDGSALNTTKWTYDIGNWGWGNNELQYYTEGRAKNARIENGNLIIEARKDGMGGKWTSTRLTTRGKVSFLYGKIEFRAKVPPNRGNWAAGWTLGDEYVDELSWPYCGEIDIMESVGYEMEDETGNGVAHASAHCRAYYFKLGNQPTAIVPVKNMNNQFHTYAVEWTPDGIEAFVDDQHYFTYDDTRTEQSWPFDKPQNIILNLAMGGGWGGAQGMDERISSQKMTIDYVRVYERQ